jgi:hypothetical protein
VQRTVSQQPSTLENGPVVQTAGDKSPAVRRRGGHCVGVSPGGTGPVNVLASLMANSLRRISGSHEA